MLAPNGKCKENIIQGSLGLHQHKHLKGHDLAFKHCWHIMKEVLEGVKALEGQCQITQVSKEEAICRCHLDAQVPKMDGGEILCINKHAVCKRAVSPHDRQSHETTSSAKASKRDFHSGMNREQPTCVEVVASLKKR